MSIVSFQRSSRSTASRGYTEAGAERVLPHLAGRVPRQLLEGLELLRDLLAHDGASFHERPELGERQRRRARAEDDAGAHALTARRVGDADHGDVRDLRVRGEVVLDALRGEVLALADDHVLPSPGDAEIAGLVHDGEVAGAEEAIGGEGRVEGRVEVTNTELRAVGLDLALDVGGERAPTLVD